nr:ubiquitin carboxyl-terminal hydrolase 6 [Tanacetum cinerariifolium]
MLHFLGQGSSGGGLGVLPSGLKVKREERWVSVKWKKELYKGAEIDITQPPCVFKCQLYDLIGAPPERQTILLKGATLKGDSDWSKLGVKEGQKLMMMGTTDEIVKVLEKGYVFMEDLSEEEQVVAVMRITGEEKSYEILCKTFDHEAKAVIERVLRLLPSVPNSSLGRTMRMLLLRCWGKGPNNPTCKHWK